MSAGKYNIVIQENATFSLSIQIRETQSQDPVDLTGTTIVAAIKERFGDEVDPIVEFDVETTDLPNGKFTLSIPATVTQNLPDFKTGVWDVLVQFASGNRVRYVQGLAKFSRGVAL